MVYKVYIGKLALRLGCARAVGKNSCDSKLAFNFNAMAGGLPAGTTEADIERQFTKYGTLSSVWVARKPPGFGELPPQLLLLLPWLLDITKRCLGRSYQSATWHSSLT